MNYTNLRTHWECKIPESQQGSVQIQKFTVTETDAFFMGLKRKRIRAGTYTKLTIHNQLVMSDTPDEYRDHALLLQLAKGDILINGLGLGCCLNVILQKPAVESVTVIEKNKDVLELVAPYFPRAEIIHADAFQWKPPKGKRYNYVWHDIWPDKCVGNLPEMHRLHRKYGRVCDWQASWSREECEARKTRVQREKERRVATFW